MILYIRGGLIMKIIIVDDEYLFREALKVSIDFEKLGLEVVGEAKNGKEAINLIETHLPEIALVDINMPIIDGLEFSAYIHDNNLDTRIIIISGYDQFDYAKEAMHNSVHSYLLKPIDEQELEKELKDVIRAIEVERSTNEEVSALRAQAKRNIPFLKERMILDILLGHYDVIDSILESKLSYLDIKLPYDNFCVLVFDIVIIEVLDEETMETHRITLKKLIDYLFGEINSYYWTYDYKRRLCIIFENNTYYNEENITSKIKSLLKAMHRFKKISCYIGISNIYNNIEYTNTAYKEALAAISHCVNHKQSYCFYSTIEERGIGFVVIGKEQRSEILINMRTSNTVEVLKALENIFKKMRNRNLYSNYIRYVYMELTLICIELLSEYEEKEEIFDKWIKELYDENKYNQPFEQLEEWLKSIFIEVISRVDKNKNRKSLAMVNKIKRYINDHYNENNFTIDKIAKALYVNYSHLCYIFKKETNITINEYLVEKRLSQAIALMDEGYTVVNSISQLVGFSDSGYFSKSFKKYMGITPSKYINSKN